MPPVTEVRFGVNSAPCLAPAHVLAREIAARRLSPVDVMDAPLARIAAHDPKQREPLGHRIIEVPDDFEQFESRYTRDRFTAYVPVGSIQKGQALAADGGGGGKTVQCGIRHGADLKGMGPMPDIAGRSPSYIVRPFYDFKHASGQEWEAR